MPYVQVRPAGRAKIETICTKFVSGVGFSNGCALFALKKPPPLMPSILIASCEAVGPMASTCFTPSSVAISRYAARFCSTPWETRNSAYTKEMGRRT